MIITALLVLWFVLWLYTHFGNRVKGFYFSQKLVGVKKIQWDLEFKKFKLEELREDVRKELDRMADGVAALEAQILSRKDKPEFQNTVDELEKQKKPLVEDVERLTKQIDSLDKEISGTDPNENASVQMQLDSTYELEEMLRDFIKQK